MNRTFLELLVELNYMKNKIVIKFRPIRRSDISNYVKWLNNPKANQFMVNRNLSVKSATKWFNWYIENKNNKSFIVSDGAKDIGFVGLRNINKQDKNADLTIYIGEDEYRGRGVGKDVMKWITSYGFSKLKLHKINLGVLEGNIIAIKLYKSLGFKVEGTMKDEIFFNGKFCNTLAMALFNKN
ncbi:MAG: UDP-4-amino-4,6-dideoxy-N-acetyl-beta-L-altrosamine N-acetyltransferase [Parcubacteria group bacterium]|nr:UDP-4-amino-4,6-dideoxy-N-acetyl-beta-L-altrosamine N-acetyltransferase [Parcubacteria group bacterium]